jgi:mannose-6-phosphate isomerase
MNYEWGKVGANSLVYQLAHATDPSLPPSRPYAELWMGDHPSGPSRSETGLRIPEIEGSHPIPYLFKVLSIQKPLSLQAHPNKEYAQVLHSKDPKNYPDPNHKPEMGLFITRTVLLYGFRPFLEIIHFLKVIPEFSQLVNDDTKRPFIDDPTASTFKTVFTAFLRYSKTALPTLNSQFISKLSTYSSIIGEAALTAIQAIRAFFPDDIGVFCPLFLNTIVGEPGSALYIPTGVLHAYIKGDLYEAMALSDNVVRAAMTPKFVDIDTLLSLLNFSPTPPQWVYPTAVAQNVAKYVPPSPEFLLYRVSVVANQIITLQPFPHEAIVSVLEGLVRLNDKVCPRGVVVLYFAGDVLTVRGAVNSAIVVASYD